MRLRLAFANDAQLPRESVAEAFVSEQQCSDADSALPIRAVHRHTNRASLRAISKCLPVGCESIEKVATNLTTPCMAM